MVYIVTDYIYNLRIVIILNNDNILHFIDRCRSEMSEGRRGGKGMWDGGEEEGDEEDRRAGIRIGWKLI